MKSWTPEQEEQMRLHKLWLTKVRYQLVKHLNRVELILGDKCVYAVDKESFVGIETFTIDHPSGHEDDNFTKGWISHDWAMDNLESDLKRLRKLVHHDKRYKGYRSVVKEATAYLVKLKKEIRHEKGNTKTDVGISGYKGDHERANS